MNVILQARPDAGGICQESDELVQAAGAKDGNILNDRSLLEVSLRKDDGFTAEGAGAGYNLQNPSDRLDLAAEPLLSEKKDAVERFLREKAVGAQHGDGDGQIK